MSMNPRITTEKIKKDYMNYVQSILTVRDDDITNLAGEEIKHTKFVKGPFLEITLPFEDGKTLKDLAEGKECLISKEFGKMGKNVHYDDWKLRVHQQKALEHIIKDDRNMIVSTGTGSGKTECYLYPIFDALMKEKENGSLNPGVRALLIFPMNALANDQQKKLRKLLANYPDITFGRYTGETEHKGQRESAEEAEIRMHKQYDEQHQYDSDVELRKSIKNELMCREYMAQNPPHILLTNYAMLEYMLLQPNTAPFFDDENAKNWRFIVIDEAHTYKGAVGTEIGFLLRRLKERIRHHMHEPFRCIATSATLGTEGGKAALAEFASKLFGEPFEDFDVITTERKRREPESDARDYSPEEYAELKEQVKDMPEEEKGIYLYDKLVSDRRLFKVYESLADKPKDITEVADTVFSDIEDNTVRERALIDLIEVAAAAKPSEFESALLPARYHLFVKSLEGLFVEYYPKKRVFLDRRERYKDGIGQYAVFEMANCQKCNQEYILGKTITKDNNKYLVQTSSDEKPEFYYVHEGSIDESFDEDDDFEESANISSLDKYWLCLSCGCKTDYAEKPNYNCCPSKDHSKIVTVYNLKYSGKSHESNCCPACGATKEGLIKRFLTANQPATFAVAKSLYDAIPPRPKKRNENESSCDDLFDDDLFADLAENTEMDQKIADESGRKLLIFSDNRQEAAFFAGFFEKKYRLAMWRRIILKCLNEAEGGELPIDDLIAKVKQKADQEGLYALNLDEQNDNLEANPMNNEQKKQMAARYVMQEFISPDIATGLEGMGYIQIMPDAPATIISNKNASRYGVTGGDNIWNIYRFLFDTLRQKGTVIVPNEISLEDEFFSPRNREGYFRNSESDTIYNGRTKQRTYIFGFMPSEGHKNKRSEMMKKILNADNDKEDNSAQAISNLQQAYDDILNNLRRAGYISNGPDSDRGTVYALNYKKWKFKLIDPADKVYKCRKCGKIFAYSILNICPELKCDGELEEIESSNVRSRNYYDHLYFGDQFIPMIAREHTAQLSSKTARQYQEKFEQGAINVLSCSTTFEMGVDVGELEATFQRNVPPETANYIQRAGRAGRRTSSAAFSVTFARRNSHDMNFFQKPSEIIAGKISAPRLEVDNEKIAIRHLNSVIVAAFFKHNPDFFNGNTKRIVSYDDKDNMAIELKRWLDTRPSELLDTIHTVFDEQICDELGVDNWEFIDEIVGEDGKLTIAIHERETDISNLHELRGEIDPNNSRDLDRAKAIAKLIATFDKEPSISFLSAKGVLPKYGFPIDTVSLDILYNKDRDAEKIDLSRDLRMAISEFAPPAQIVANGKLWQSYAINTIPDKGWPTYVYHECPVCKKIYPPREEVTEVTINVDDDVDVCQDCGAEMKAKKFIIPLFGFSTSYTEKPKQVGETRPRAFYNTQTQFWNDTDLTERQQQEVKTRTIVFKGKELTAKYSPGGRLFVLNQGKNGAGLYVCPECGCCKDIDQLKSNKVHKNKFGKNCINKHLQRVSLGHQFSTDILKIQIPEHTVPQNYGDNTEYKDQLLSLMYAILEGASTALDISRSDISGCVTSGRQIILYDDTPGGSGFVKYIYENLETVLRQAKDKVNGSCGCTEETSCYGCLRNYGNQFYHDILSRGLAYNYLDWLLNEESVHSVEPEQPRRQTTRRVVSPEFGTRELPNYVVEDYEIRRSPIEEIYSDILKDERITDQDKTVFEKIYKYLREKNYEVPASFAKIETNETNVWPAIFWPESRVALFWHSQSDEYENLRTYNYHCFYIDDDLDVDNLIKLISEVE